MLVDRISSDAYVVSYLPSDMSSPGTESASISLPMPTSHRIDTAYGEYHALIIGNDNYKNIPSLTTAVNDAQAVCSVLQKEFGFRVKLLVNATRQQIIDALDDVRRDLDEKDNLLIYYAGHGWLDRETDRGFWLPIDSSQDRRANWVSNSDITDALKATRAKHVLLVADSCYSGTLTRGLSTVGHLNLEVSTLARKRTRIAFTSGGIEPVSDVGGSGHSVFARALLDALHDAPPVLEGAVLFTTVRKNVLLSAQQTPEYGEIRFTGHEGGDFLFVRQREYQ